VRNADHLAPSVRERPTRVTGPQGDGQAQHVTWCAGQDAQAGRVALAHWVTDRDHQIAHAQPVGVADRRDQMAQVVVGEGEGVVALIDGVLMIIGSIYVLLIRNDFQGALTSFLLLLAAALTVWAAIFLVDMIWRRSSDTKSLNIMGSESAYYYTGGFNIPACIAWVVGVVVGLLFTSSSFFTGPLAKSSPMFANTSLGYLLCGVVSIVLFLALRPFFLSKKGIVAREMQEEPPVAS